MLARLLHKIRSAVVKVLDVATKEDVEALRAKDRVRHERMADLHKKVWYLYYKHAPYEPYDEDEAPKKGGGTTR